MNFEGIDPKFATEVYEAGPSYPAIQLSEYRPRTLKDEIKLCISERSLDLIKDKTEAFVRNPTTAIYREDEETMFILPNEARFIALGLPNTFVQHKDTKEITPLEKGVKLAGTKKVTVTRLPVCLLLGEEIVKTESGEPQIFTIKLTSSKTALVNGDFRDKDKRSLKSLREKLSDHFKVRGQSLLHLVSVELSAKACKFTSSLSAESSLGAIFELGGNARPLPPELQEVMYQLVLTDEVKELLEDPFHLKGNGENTALAKVKRIAFDELKFTEAALENCCQDKLGTSQWRNLDQESLGILYEHLSQIKNSVQQKDDDDIPF